jgi:hypothetical protein
MTNDASLDEADLLFGRLFPRILVHEADKLRALEGSVEFRVTTDPPRIWRLQGGAPPHLRSGPVEGGAPDVVFTMSPALVKRIVRGGDIDLVRARTNGELAVEGSLPALLSFELDPAKLLPKLAGEVASPAKKRVAPRPSAPPLSPRPSAPPPKRVPPKPGKKS